jgi:DinB superfamily
VKPVLIKLVGKSQEKRKENIVMQNDKALRQHLLNLVKSADAHVDFETAIKDFPPALQGQRPKGAAHSPWEVLEHLRITQWDILEFSRNPKHKSPEFPAGYWPGTQEPPNKNAWEQSAQAFRKDLAALCDLVANDTNDLFAKVRPDGEQTLLREALLAADHNAYHIGEFVVLRRLLGAWK